MKRSKWLVVAGLVIMMMTIGCKKMGDPANAAFYTQGNPLELPLYVQGAAPYQIGHVRVWDDAVSLYVQYDLDALPADGSRWEIYRGMFSVVLDPLDFPTTDGEIDGWKFPYSDYAVAPFQTLTVVAPLGSWSSSTIVDIAAACIVHRFPDASSQTYTEMAAWAYDPTHPFINPDGTNHGWWFQYTFGPGGEFTPGTAWGGHAMPEWNMWEFPGKNWALYLYYHPLTQTSYVGDLYLGNPKNDPASHVVGTVTVSDDVGTLNNIYVTYQITAAGLSIFDGHTAAAGTLPGIPQKNGNPIPGQFDYFFGPFNPTVTSVTVTIPYQTAWGDDVYIGAHAIVGF